MIYYFLHFQLDVPGGLIRGGLLVHFSFLRFIDEGS
jgi:hypothetical protein